MTNTQSVIFQKTKWGVEDAIRWLRLHNYPGLLVDEKPDTWRFRQFDPKKGAKYRTLRLPHHVGIDLVLEYPE